MGESAFLEVGKITGLHGLKGGLRAHLYAGPESVCLTLNEIGLQTGPENRGIYRLTGVRPQRRGFVLSLEGITDRDQAEALVGAAIVVARRDLPALDEDSFYWYELMGMAVTGSDGAFMGTIVQIIATGSNDVYVVRDGDRETLVPALNSVITHVDRRKGTMTVDLPEGL